MGGLPAAVALVHLHLPNGQEALECGHDIRTAAGEVGPFAWITAEIKQQQLTSIDQQLPLSESRGALVAIGSSEAEWLSA